LLGVGALADAAGLVSFLGSTAERDRVRRIEEQMDAFAKEHRIEQVREGLELAALDGCYEAGWALFFADLAGRLSYVPVEGLRPVTAPAENPSITDDKGSRQVDWSTAAILENHEAVMVVRWPHLSASRLGGGSVSTGRSSFTTRKEVGSGTQLVILGYLAIENRVLSRDPSGVAPLMGVRREPAPPICSMLPPVSVWNAQAVGTPIGDDDD
jgi:hypothetical protein